MTMEQANPPMDAPPSAAALACDRKLEVLLDDMVASSPALPPDFAARVVAACPFAPWEVRRASAWKVPFFAAGGLFAASVAVFLAPLGQLAPGTAIEVWGQLVVATLTSPVAAAMSAGPALAAAVESLRGVVAPGVALAVLGTGLAFGAATAAALRRRTARVPR